MYEDWQIALIVFGSLGLLVGVIYYICRWEEKLEERKTEKLDKLRDYRYEEFISKIQKKHH